MSIQVAPHARRLGVGSALYERIVRELAGRGVDALTTVAREDQEGALAFLDARDFTGGMRFPVSRLDVAAFDRRPFEATLGRVAEHGIRIRALSELMSVFDDWRRRVYDLGWAIEQDIPLPDAPTRLDFEHFVKRFEHPSFAPDAWYFALDGDRWVGLSTLWPHPPGPERMYTGVTGVVRTHRRLGIATALKLHAIEHARARGARDIETDNEENNPMYLLNLALGFVSTPAWIAFSKRPVIRTL